MKSFDKVLSPRFTMAKVGKIGFGWHFNFPFRLMFGWIAFSEMFLKLSYEIIFHRIIRRFFILCHWKRRLCVCFLMFNVYLNCKCPAKLDNLFRGSMTIHLICCDPAVSNQYGKIPNTDLPLWHFAFALVSLYFMRSTRSLN